MKILLSIVVGVTLIKVLTFFVVNKIKVAPRKSFDAEEVIRSGHMNPILYKERLKNTIIDYTRDNDVEEEYEVVKDLFKYKLQHKEISRWQIIGIENYLREQLKDKRRYKNNAHAIYSMLKNPTLTINHTSTIKKFLCQ
ncbi:hypothetical protein [Clostridium sp.]|jgi:hypothetical protein|uniref:hypothetical protein n=1 Tax=Clostridium sp. TaxID=1506 RepID=UPI00290D9FA5|nr:hypothetical protein [Clostridium sp.]MDU7364267.1 hypothetical protein [Clostridium sp.]